MNAAVITISDSGFRREREDRSGPAVADFLKQHGWEVIAERVIPDERIVIENEMINLAEEAQLVVTTGGTGISERDVTPEATRSVCDRILDGIGECMRVEGSKHTPLAYLSRAVCGVRGQTLVLNLPGSPKGALQSLEAVIELLPHALELLSGKTEHVAG